MGLEGESGVGPGEVRGGGPGGGTRAGVHGCSYCYSRRPPEAGTPREVEGP